MQKCTLSIEKGESIFSLLLRYCRWTSIDIEEIVGTAAVHQKTILRDLPLGVHGYEAYTGSKFQRRQALLAEHSAAMYFSASIADEFRHGELQMSVKKSTMLDRISIGTMWSHMRFCPECAVDEYRTFRYSWWHRDHQLPLSVVCLQHRRLLVHTVLDYRSATLPHERMDASGKHDTGFDDLLAICRLETFLAGTTKRGALRQIFDSRLNECSNAIRDKNELEERIQLTVKTLLVALRDAGMGEPALDWNHLRIRSIALLRGTTENCAPVIATLVATACRRLCRFEG